MMTTPPNLIHTNAKVCETPESMPHSAFSTPSTVFEARHAKVVSSASTISFAVPTSPEDHALDADTSATPTPPAFIPEAMDRSLSEASIPILFDSSEDVLGLGLGIRGAQLMLETPLMDRSLSSHSTESSTSDASRRRFSGISTLTDRSRASYATESTEPPTPFDEVFEHRGPCSTGSSGYRPCLLAPPLILAPTAKLRSQSAVPSAGLGDAFRLRPRAATVSIAPSPIAESRPALFRSSRSSSQTARLDKFTPPKLTDRQRKLFGESYRPTAHEDQASVGRSPRLGEDLETPSSDRPLPSPTDPGLPPASNNRRSPQASPRLKTPPSRIDGRTIAERRGSPPQAPIKIPSPPRRSSLAARTTSHSSSRVEAPRQQTREESPGYVRVELCAEATTPSSGGSKDSSVYPASAASAPTFNASNAISDDLPVGELFRTLQLWFDQEGFREIAPLFRFQCYSATDDLLYFTTTRVGFPFHFDIMQQLPTLRRVVAPDYEDAYALLEGKSHRYAAGRRDFIGRQASLDIKAAGRYQVEGREGKGGEWIWKLTYEVEERTSMVGRHLRGERSLFPLTFACSPEILDPSHARKANLFNNLKKSMSAKCAAVALGSDGLPLRPRGKSLGSRSRGRSDSASRLLQSPRTASSTRSTDSLASSPASRVADDPQARLFRTIAPASSSRLRPSTANSEHRPTLRHHKTAEQLRRPITADHSAPSMPLLTLFGIAQQPSRATPTRGTTCEGRSASKTHRTVTAFSPVC